MNRRETTIRRWRKLPLGRRVSWLVIYVAYLAGLSFAGFKVYYKIKYAVPFGQSLSREDLVWCGWYTELFRSKVLETQITPRDGCFDVLLLGGSVLLQNAESVTHSIEQHSGDCVRVFNLAASAHTSRDSYHKHSRLAETPFDLIVIYHGINDVRMNCCLPGTFRIDYTHSNWYASFHNSLNRARRSGAARLDETGAATTGVPTEEQLDCGALVRTPDAVRQNLAAIITQAERWNTRVLLLTFSIYVPQDYTRERMLAGTLDYGEGQWDMPIECWGRPENVQSTINAQNAVMRDLAAQYDHVALLDMASEFPADGRHFSDVCHMTEAGIQEFTDRLTESVISMKPR